ncbi:hypothetical protein ACFE33_10950 [Falsihalocynthiibacter sp. SS001]|uniref:hypothetical protein n=1 Tax=Falsihalocynthiibacter sp. SS001 TaxID=3349698 RepID=UPI0036D28FD3
MRHLIFACLISLPTLVAADHDFSPIGAAEFDSYVTGKTLTYAQNGEKYGSEEYMSGNRVRWSFHDGNCHEGIWFPKGENICFLYEGEENAQCWVFSMAEDGLVARVVNFPPASSLYETSKSNAPLYCKGPEVGV